MKLHIQWTPNWSANNLLESKTKVLDSKGGFKLCIHYILRNFMKYNVLSVQLDPTFRGTTGGPKESNKMCISKIYTATEFIRK